ncbi:hypothetical protein F4819DRAFT_442154 [Hypoxylon fuscum]|nr:hypothetical protein F4819DRAFT_442154 [Hypoxylon fuscum]
MYRLRASCVALCLSLAGQATLASPTNFRRAACTELSTTVPKWELSNAMSSDWPGGQSGRVQMFAHHMPTDEVASCVVNYMLNQTDGHIIDYDPTATHGCVNFGNSALNTTVKLNMETLLLNIESTWACEEDETTYTATGSTILQRDTSPGSCLVEPSQAGDSTTCPIGNVEVEGNLQGIIVNRHDNSFGAQDS